MGATGQLTALRTEPSPVVAALAAARSRRFISMPDLVKAGFKDSTTPITVIGHFHGAGMGMDTESTGAPIADASVPNPGESTPPGAPVWSTPEKAPELLWPESSTPGLPALEAALLKGAAAADALRSMAADEARLFGFVEAADFAGRVEEISRSLEYLQVVAAQAVERTRQEAQQTSPGSSAFGAGPGWRTGWTEPEPASETPASAAAGARSISAGASVSGAGSVTGPGPVTEAAGSVSPLDDGYRNAAEFLRARLRISIGEARRRLALAPDVLPQTGIAGQQIPARREVLANALASALVPSRSATIISTALDTVRQLTDEDTITRMEHALTTTAMESDPDFVAKMTKRWTDVIDQDGAEPSEEVLRQLQGAFLRRRRRHGLHHLEIFATAEQYETLTTAMNT
ncbi:DUF222 domain-containing protein, partial [Paenarthrobacter nitroguajacolicus]|uniref:DUF222 domain-containing protein n=1 Tax=Paenarthrobacter nitroguajacolicus TaxID=211146 RepID=UPI0021186CB5